MIPRPRAGMRLCEAWNNSGRPRSVVARARQAMLCLRWAWRVLWHPDQVRTEVYRSSACVGIMENRERRERGEDRLMWSHEDDRCACMRSLDGARRAAEES